MTGKPSPDQSDDSTSRSGIAWDEGGVPRARRFDDPYFSLKDGAAETRHVFIEGNGLPDAWRRRPYTSIAELGFGTGLNFLVTWALWRDTRPEGAQLSFTSFEAFPLTLAEMERALSAFGHLEILAERLLVTLPSRWPPHGEERPIRLDRQTQLMVVIGDARETVPEWAGKAHHWYLDGFSPAKNPDMWDPDLLKAVADHTRSGGTIATYSAAGWVRRNLEEAGFTVEKRDGFAGKRHMTIGAKRS